VIEVELRFPTWIGVVCDDLDGQGAFYRDVLGLHEADRGEDWIQYDLGPGNTFELIRRSDDPEYDARRYQVGFVVDDIHAARRRLIDRGVEPVTDVLAGSDGTSSWAYFRDRERNVFEITER
jgi:catechol 2,3-dioxygenase-like lactoylglutathione lyase family enzyme